jgi:hypothetical protein
MRRPTRNPHATRINMNGRDFDQAYVSASPIKNLATHRGTPFSVEAGIVRRGKRAGQPVLIFRRDGRERARAYKCCWGFDTNCNRTYIDVYTTVLW